MERLYKEVLIGTVIKKGDSMESKREKRRTKIEMIAYRKHLQDCQDSLKAFRARTPMIPSASKPIDEREETRE